MTFKHKMLVMIVRDSFPKVIKNMMIWVCFPDVLNTQILYFLYLKGYCDYEGLHSEAVFCIENGLQ